MKEMILKSHRPHVGSFRDKTGPVFVKKVNQFKVYYPFYALYCDPRRDKCLRWVPVVVIKKGCRKRLDVRGPTWNNFVNVIWLQMTKNQDTSTMLLFRLENLPRLFNLRRYHPERRIHNTPIYWLIPDSQQDKLNKDNNLLYSSMSISGEASGWSERCCGYTGKEERSKGGHLRTWSGEMRGRGVLMKSNLYVPSSLAFKLMYYTFLYKLKIIGGESVISINESPHKVSCALFSYICYLLIRIFSSLNFYFS